MGYLGSEDIVLLIEDGVYAAAAGTVKSGLIEKLLEQNEVYALQADIKARGLEQLIKKVKITDYEGFVDLIEQHTPQSWL